MFSVEKCMVVASLILIAKQTEAADCTVGEDKISSACDCCVGADCTANDGSVGKFCFKNPDPLGKNVAVDACAADMTDPSFTKPLSAPCACVSLDGYIGTITGYANGKFCTKSEDGNTVGSFTSPCATNVVLAAECACGSSDDTVGTIVGYADGKVCTQGGDTTTVGAFALPACTASADTAMPAQCNCASGATNGDAAAGAFCVAKSGTNTLLAACATNVVLAAECACGSSDNKKGTIVGYAPGKICTKGVDAGTVGSFAAPAKKKTKAPAPAPTTDASSTLSTCALTLVVSLFAMAVLC